MDIVDVELQRLVQLRHLLGIPLELNRVCIVQVLRKMLQELLSGTLRILRGSHCCEHDEVFVHVSLVSHLSSIDVEKRFGFILHLISVRGFR